MDKQSFWQALKTELKPSPKTVSDIVKVVFTTIVVSYLTTIIKIRTTQHLTRKNGSP